MVKRPPTRAFLIFLGLSVLACSKAWIAPTTNMVGSGGDLPQYAWFLQWTPFALTHGQNPLFTDYLNWPHGVNLMWNAFMPLSGLLLWPITHVLGPIFAYNVLVTVALALNGWCAYLALRRYVSKERAAFAGGLFYAASPYLSTHWIYHGNLLQAFVPPLVLLLLDDVVIRRRTGLRKGLMLSALFVVQLFISEEVVASLGLAILITVGVLVAMYPREAVARMRVLRVVVVAACVFGVFAGVPIAYQFFGPQRVFGIINPSGVYVNDLLGFVVPGQPIRLSPANTVGVSLPFTGTSAEWGAYLGFLVIAIVVYTAWRWWRELPVVRIGVVSAAVLSLLSLGPTLHVWGNATGIPLPWRLFETVPVVQNIMPARLMLYVDLWVAVLLGLCSDRLLFAQRSHLRTKLVAVLAAISVAPIFPTPVTVDSTPAFFKAGNDIERVPQGSVVLVAPFSQGPLTSEPMLWQATANLRFRMVGGSFLGPFPGVDVYGPPYTSLYEAMYAVNRGEMPTLTVDLLDRLRREIAADQVHTIVVGPMPHQENMVKLLTWAEGRSPVVDQGVYVWWAMG